jgi:hypothetical protein
MDDMPRFMSLRPFLPDLRWSGVSSYVDGWISRISMTVSIVGYLIVFNDSIGGSISFSTLANQYEAHTHLGDSARLRFVYFGLIALGLSNLMFRIFQPRTFKIGRNELKYITEGLRSFTFHHYRDIYNTHGDALDSLLPEDGIEDSYKGFEKDSTELVVQSGDLTSQVGWEQIVGKYGLFLRTMLHFHFETADKKRASALWVCLTVSTIGYVFLFIPSVDLFVRVLRATV